MKGKIALEEHIESPDFPATGTHNFTDASYFEDVENRLQEYKLRLQDMDVSAVFCAVYACVWAIPGSGPDRRDRS